MSQYAIKGPHRLEETVALVFDVLWPGPFLWARLTEHAASAGIKFSSGGGGQNLLRWLKAPLWKILGTWAPWAHKVGTYVNWHRVYRCPVYIVVVY